MTATPPHRSDTPTGLVTHHDLETVRRDLDAKIETVRKDVSGVSGDVGRLAVENAKQTQKLDLLLKQKDRDDAAGDRDADVTAHGQKVKLDTRGKIIVTVVGLMATGGGVFLHWLSTKL